MAAPWMVLGESSGALEGHLAWDLLPLSPPQVRALPVELVAVVLPHSRDAEREVFLQACAADGVPVARRPSGGGAVVLAPGMVTLSALAPLALGRQVDRLFAFFCSWVIKGLQLLGVRELSLQGVSDLCVAERKVVGTALRLLRDKVLFQASVLVDPPLALLPRYLPYPSRAPAYRKGRSHLDFVTSLKELGYTLTPPEVAEGLSFAFQRALGNLSANPSPLGEAAFSAP